MLTSNHPSPLSALRPPVPLSMLDRFDSVFPIVEPRPELGHRGLLACNGVQRGARQAQARVGGGRKARALGEGAVLQVQAALLLQGAAELRQGVPQLPRPGSTARAGAIWC